MVRSCCIHMTKRNNQNANIIRMEMLYPSAGEIWYLRLILLNRPCSSYKDAKTFEGIVYQTFQLSAIAHKYVESEKETSLCFQEASLFSTPSELRFLFASLTIQGFPTLHIFNDPMYFDSLTNDFKFQIRIPQSQPGFMNALLCELQHIFAESNQTLSEYGLPEPNEYPSELEMEKLKYCHKEQLQLFRSLNIANPNTDEQENIMQEIMNRIDYNQSKKYFIQGQGGCGKTFLAKTILAYTRSKGHIALGNTWKLNISIILIIF